MIGLLLLLSAFITGELPKIYLFGLPLLLNDLAVFLFVLIFFTIKFLKREKLRFDTVSFFGIVFFLTAFISLLLSSVRFTALSNLIAVLYLWRWISYFGLYLAFKNSSYKSQTIFKALITAVFIIALIGLIQYFLFPDLRFLTAFGWDPHLFRLTAPFLDPSFTGAVLNLGLVLLFTHYPFDHNKGMRIFIGAVLYFALALTYSRASYLMYFVIIVCTALSKKSWLFFVSLTLWGVGTLLILPQNNSYGENLKRQETIQARFVNWQESLAIWKKNFIIGVGFNHYGDVRNRLDIYDHAKGGSDSSLLFVGATTGIIGLLFYLLLLWNIFIKSSIFVKISLIGILVHSFFSNSLFYPFIMEWLWIIAG